MLRKREEEYIESIYDVVQDKGYAKVKDIADGLGVGLSSVTEMVQKLDEKGFIDYKKYSGITLTEKGEDKAIDLSKKHEVLQNFFTILGLDEDTADEEACKIEHVVKKATMERLTDFVDFIQKEEESQCLERFEEYYLTEERSGDLED